MVAVGAESLHAMVGKHEQPAVAALLDSGGDVVEIAVCLSGYRCR
jgi:hypothetical protein